MSSRREIEMTPLKSAAAPVAQDKAAPDEHQSISKVEQVNDDQLVDFDEEKVQTSFGLLTVEVLGDRRKPAMLTYHDIGLNASSCFQSFFQFSDMATVAERFCVYHVNAPGAEEDADKYEPERTAYPGVDDLAQMIISVVEHFKLKNFIGFGVGMGANVLIRFAMKYPKLVDALIIVNASVQSAGWLEWGYQRANSSYLRSRGMTAFTVNYLLWHHFGRRLDECSQDSVDSYRHYFSSCARPVNLACLIDSWVARTPVDLQRGVRTLGCPVLQVVGAGSPHIDETVDLNSKLDPSKSDYMKVSDACGLVLEDAPLKVTEAVILFLQGQGYMTSVSHKKWLSHSSAGGEHQLDKHFEHTDEPVNVHV